MYSKVGCWSFMPFVGAKIAVHPDAPTTARAAISGLY